MSYNDYLESIYWKKHVKPLVYRLARGVCHRCDSHTGLMHTHHKKVHNYEPCYDYKGFERFIVDQQTLRLRCLDACLLCEECHSFIHGFSSYDPLKDYSELIPAPNSSAS